MIARDAQTEGKRANKENFAARGIAKGEGKILLSAGSDFGYHDANQMRPKPEGYLTINYLKKSINLE